jgi:hypothetical protein
MSSKRAIKSVKKAYVGLCPKQGDQASFIPRLILFAVPVCADRGDATRKQQNSCSCIWKASNRASFVRTERIA